MNNDIDFIGIGALRCGTSWIANVLRAHPRICISEPKEVRYFNRMQTQVGKLKGKVNTNFDRDISWYLKHFSHAKLGQLRGEISPVYLSDLEAPVAIKARFPDIKLIVSLRNPVASTYSLYRMFRSTGRIEEMSFEDALEKEDVFLRNGMYGKHMAHYLEHFNRDQILLLVFEELIAEPERELGRIFDHLGLTIPSDLDPSKFHTNESAKRRSKWFHEAAFKSSRWLVEHDLSKALVLLRTIGVHKLFHRINTASVKHEQMNDETCARLENIFRDDITRLETLLDVDLRCWKRDQ